MLCCVLLFLVVSTSVIDCPERLVSEMTYYVSSGMLNRTHSLTHLSQFREHTGGPSVPVREISLIAYLPLVQPTENSRPDLDLNPDHRRSSASRAQQVLWLRKPVSPLSVRDRPKTANSWKLSYAAASVFLIT